MAAKAPFFASGDDSLVIDMLPSHLAKENFVQRGTEVFHFLRRASQTRFRRQILGARCFFQLEMSSRSGISRHKVDARC